jgi:hypothetical protein
MKTQNLARYTIWANRAVMAVVAALMLALPSLLRWYCSLLNDYVMPQRDLTGIWVSYIPCALVILYALWNVEKIMDNLLAQKVFIRENVQRVRRVQHCCGIVAVVCAIDVVFVLPMLLFGAIMGFLCLAVSVLANVLEAAVVLREENDLTI